MTTAEMIELLGLEEHPEGGWFAETYRSSGRICRADLGDEYDGERAFSTAIYYLLAADTSSLLHRILTDEVLHHYIGAEVEVLELRADGSGRVLMLGSDLAGGARPQIVIPAGSWFGFRVRDKAGLALIGATVAPGFEFADFEIGDRKALTAQYPEFADFVAQLTP